MTQAGAGENPICPAHVRIVAERLEAYVEGYVIDRWRNPEQSWIRRRVCGLRGLPVGGLGSSLPVMLFELNRGQVPDRGVQPVGVVPVGPAGDLPFDVSAVGPGRPGEVDRFCFEQPDGRFA